MCGFGFGKGPGADRAASNTGVKRFERVRHPPYLGWKGGIGNPGIPIVRGMLAWLILRR